MRNGKAESQSFLVLLLNFSKGYSFLMFGESMAENIYDSVSNMTAIISGKSHSDLFCLLL